MKILIVEDEKDIRLFLTDLLEANGHQVTEASHGVEALELTQNSSPDLIISDILMPEMDGYVLCRSLKTNPLKQHIPFIFYSAFYGDEQERELGLLMGASRFLIKPMEPEDLLMEIHGLLDAVARGAEQIPTCPMTSLDTLNSMYERVVSNKVYAKINEINGLELKAALIKKNMRKLQKSPFFDGPNLRSLELPKSIASGDILLSAFRPNGVQHICFGDLTGHGSMAAVASLFVSDIFYYNTLHDVQMHDLIKIINDQLLETLPRFMFMAAICIEFDPSDGLLTVWNSSMCDAVLYRKSRRVIEFPSTRYPFGIMSSFKLEPQQWKIHPGDRLFAYSDGLFEQTNDQGLMFGKAGLDPLLDRLVDQDESLQSIVHAFVQFCNGKDQADDVTLFEFTY
ncbi:SpoIIE family protein phosphatase [Magnetococcales bacterium HHB-1]